MRKLYFLPTAALLMIMTAGIFSACNSSSSSSSDYDPASDVAVTSFYIKANSKIMSNLDSVFFSLDLENGLIFNADSLPVGTDVQALIPVITYPSTVSAATIQMEGGTHRTGTVDYLNNPTDSIDFTGKVTLYLTAEDGINAKSYDIKVNVHKMNPDSLWWDNMAVAKLPSRFENPKTQKTITKNKAVYSLIAESNGSYTLSKSTDLSAGTWTKSVPTFTFSPDISSFNATDDDFYILDEAGALYKSDNGTEWVSTGLYWQTIIGAYSDCLLGIRSENGIRIHTSYPSGKFTDITADDTFPVSGMSNMGVYTTKWSTVPIALVAGGRLADGSLSGKTWAYDGNVWTVISNTDLPEAEGAMLIPYFIYLKQSTLWLTTEYSIWMYMGGRNADGTANQDIKISYNNGVIWQDAPDEMQLPDYLPEMIGASPIIFDTPLSASFSPAIWRQIVAKPIRKINYDIDGTTINWDCPYIYLFGGINAEGTLNNTIWRGVLNRMSFKPLI